jgi:1-deoxy-D-xylulose-5-phosphate reductoisomerase
VLGATGSVGRSTLALVRADRAAYRVTALVGGSRAAPLAALAREVRAELAVVADPAAYLELRTALAGSGIEAAAGPEAVLEAAIRPVDWVMSAIVGAVGLAPTLAALQRGRMVAIANKECLVSAGSLLLAAARASGAVVLPVDSEHNAIFQVLAGHDREAVDRLILTASGGPFRTLDRAAMARVTVEQALNHPNWSMGAKITIDSATMMNKGLELIEAAHLFPIPLDRIGIVIHPQSVVHSLVEYRDGSTLAQLGPSDMRVPIASCLAWPRRMDTPCRALDLAALGQLTFFAPDEERFPATRLARRAAEAGGAAPAVLNAANEVAVAAFLAGQIGFTRIAALVEETLTRPLPPAPATLDDVLSVDAAARAMAAEMLEIA